VSQHNAVFFVLAFVACVIVGSVPKSKSDVTASIKGGLATVVLSMLMNAVFQWDDSSPLNLLFLEPSAGVVETILFAIGLALVFTGIYGAARLAMGRRSSRD
jgi:hypothetical protein